MNNIPTKIKIKTPVEEIIFTLTDKREIKYYGRTEHSNEALHRIDKLEDNEVLYKSEWGWGVIVNTDRMEIIYCTGTPFENQKIEIYE